MQQGTSIPASSSATRPGTLPKPLAGFRDPNEITKSPPGPSFSSGVSARNIEEIPAAQTGARMPDAGVPAPPSGGWVPALKVSALTDYLPILG
jgi:hypothetical protein